MYGLSHSARAQSRGEGINKCYDSSCFSAAPIMSELVCVTSGCKDGGVGIETRGARRIAITPQTKFQL